MQPDQNTEAWAPFVADYEAIFEPLTDAFAGATFDALGSLRGVRLLDVGCGPGGAALLAARRGADVCAIDASKAMIDRVAMRAHEAGLAGVRACVMDAGSLDCPDASFDIAYSGFGIVLLPDPLLALRELRRVLRSGGKAVVVTWTQPERYEVAARLRRAIERVRGSAPTPASLPAQLRYTDGAVFAELMKRGGFAEPTIHKLESRLIAPSAAVLAEKLGFAPGMAATLDMLGADRTPVIERFVTDLEQDFGTGPVTLGAVAHAAIAEIAAS